MENVGLSIHCHHRALVEYCFNYRGRAEFIKRNKPPSEREIRLRLFKILPAEAIAELPTELIEAGKVWDEAYKVWDDAYELRNEVYEIRDEATRITGDQVDTTLDRAVKILDQANKTWNDTDRKTWHDKWCGCKYWKKGEIDFSEPVSTG